MPSRDQPWVKTLHAGVMGGAYVGMAGLLSLMVGGNITSNFINQKAIFAALLLGEEMHRNPNKGVSLWP